MVSLLYVIIYKLGDFTSAAFSDHEVCHDVAVEPVLQPVSIQYVTANGEDEARLDVSARWSSSKIFLMCEPVFNPIAFSYHTIAVSSSYIGDLSIPIKQRMYEDRVKEVVYSTGLFYFWRNGCDGYYHLLAISLFDC